MSLLISLSKKEKWIEGKIDDCTDSYCRRHLKKLGTTYGFGECIAGKYYESLGYKWIHHDFNVFGFCKIGKYPEAEEIFRKYFGDDRFKQGRGLIDVIPDSVKMVRNYNYR